jgi:hypothetical protein
MYVRWKSFYVCKGTLSNSQGYSNPIPMVTAFTTTSPAIFPWQTHQAICCIVCNVLRRGYCALFLIVGLAPEQCLGALHMCLAFLNTSDYVIQGKITTSLDPLLSNKNQIGFQTIYRRSDSHRLWIYILMSAMYHERMFLLGKC